MNSEQRRPRATPMGRFARGRRFDRNPLRRASDVIETMVLAVLVIAFAAGGPFAARASGAWAHGAARHAQISQRASRSQVPATVLATPAQQENLLADPRTRARWTAPDGKHLTGDLAVPLGTSAGATVKVWVTRDGTPSGPPLTDAQVADQADLAEGAAVTSLAGLLAALGLLARRLLDRHRMAAWDAEWRAIGPHWTTRT